MLRPGPFLKIKAQVLMFIFPYIQFYLHNYIIVGEFGRVYKGTLSVAKGKSIEVAVKGVIHKTEKEERDFQKEMAIMSKIMHPNVVRFYGMIAHGEPTITTSSAC